MDLTLREGYWIKFCMKLLTMICLDNYCSNFITLLLNRYNSRLLPLLRQFFLIPNTINELMELRTQYFTSLNKFCRNLFNTKRFIYFNFAIAISNSIGLGSGANSSDVFIYICLRPLILRAVNG
jgi:hypothetical protein